MSEEELVASDYDGVQKVIEGNHAFIKVKRLQKMERLDLHTSDFDNL